MSFLCCPVVGHFSLCWKSSFCKGRKDEKSLKHEEGKGGEVKEEWVEK